MVSNNDTIADSTRCRAPSSKVWLFKGEVLKEPMSLSQSRTPCVDLCSCMDNEEDKPCKNVIEEDEEMGSESSDEEEEVDVDDYDEDDS